MHTQAWALPLEELLRRLMKTMLSGHDIRAPLHDVELQQIEDRNSQMLFMPRSVANKRLVSMNDKMLADVYDINVGNVKKIRCVAGQRCRAESGRVVRPPAETSEQEAEIVDRLLHDASERNSS
jgi:hypothetical protein